jgi:hypothetical protein
MHTTTWFFTFGIVLAAAIGVVLLRHGPGVLQGLIVAAVFVLAIGAGVSLRSQH